MSNRRILVANYDYPPAASVGGARWVTMKKYLERLGYEVTVVTTSAFGCLPEDEAWNVVRTRDLVSSPALRRLLRRPELSPVEGGPSLERPPPALISKVIVPDVYALTWVPPAIVAIRRLLRERRFDALVTSSPKDSTHLIGLASRSKIAWVADFETAG